MFVVVVFLEVKPARLEVFREAVLRHARRTLELEPSCLQFDVCEDQELPGSFLLYQVFGDEAAFRAHQDSDHTREQSALIKDWVSSLKRLMYTGLSHRLAKLN